MVRLRHECGGVRLLCWWCWWCSFEEVLSLGLERRGGLAVVDGKRGRRRVSRSTRQDKNKTKGGRERCQASTVDQLPLSPTPAMTRSLNLTPRLRGSFVLPHLQLCRGPSHGTLLSCHQTTTHHPPCKLLCPVPRTAITCANGHVRVPACLHQRMHGGSTRAVFQ